jgi:hypothetical protein
MAFNSFAPAAGLPACMRFEWLAETGPEEPVSAGTWAIYILLIIAVLVAIGLIMKLVVWKVGVPCQFCDARLKYWEDLPLPDRAAILEYFNEVEKRDPETGAVFVCVKCGSVFDDFSGEKLHRDYDQFGLRAYCKKCNAIMWNQKDLATWDGVSESPYMKCKSCGTVHRWQMYKETRFRLLMPPPDIEVLPKCNDDGMA